MDPDSVVLQGLLLYELGVTPIAEVSIVFCRKYDLGHCKFAFIQTKNRLNGNLSNDIIWLKNWKLFIIQ